MLIRLLCTHEMTKRVCKISRLNSKRLLRKPQKMLGGYFIFPHPVHYSVFIVLTGEFWNVLKSALFSRPRPKAQDQDQGLLFCPWGVLRPRPWSRTTTLRCLETKTLIKDYHLEVSWDQDLDQGLPPWGVLRPRPWSRTTIHDPLSTNRYSLTAGRMTQWEQRWSHFDWCCSLLNLAPRHGFIGSRSGVRAVKLMSSVDKHTEVCSIPLSTAHDMSKIVIIAG